MVFFYAISWSWLSIIRTHGMWAAHPTETLLHSFRVFQSLSFPMLSTSIFSADGSVYDQSDVFDSQFQLNQTALDLIGVPALTGSNAWANLTSNLAVSLLFIKWFWLEDWLFLRLIRLVPWSHTLPCSGVHMPVTASSFHIEENNQILTIKWVMALFWDQTHPLNLLYRRCKNTKKLPGGGMLSYFVRHSLPVNHFKFFMPEFCLINYI